MEESTLNRIAEALERIANLMENSQRREINITKKERVAESKAVKSALMEQMKKETRQRLSDKKARQSPKK